MRQVLRKWLGAVLSVALVGWFVWRSWDDFPQAWEAVQEASPVWLALAVGAQLLHILLRALRWRLLLNPVKQGIGVGNLYSTTVIGYLANSILPFRVGEVVRPLLLAGRERISRSATLASVGVERILDMQTVAFFLGVYLLLFASDLGAVRASEVWAKIMVGARFAGGVALLGIPALFLLARYGDAWIGRVSGRLQPRPGGLADRALGVGRGLVQGMAGVATPGRAAAAFGASVLVWLAIALSTWLGVLGMRVETEAGFPFHATLLLVPLLALGVSAPTPGGVGGYHIICALVLEQIFGASRPAATAAAIVLWFISFLPMIVLGFYFLWRAGVRVGDLGRMAESTPPTPAAAQGNTE